MHFLLLVLNLVAAALARPSPLIQENPEDKVADNADEHLLKLAAAYIKQSNGIPTFENDDIDQQIFFYSAPETEEPRYLPIQLARPSTKNNVIFVKVPKPGPIIPQLVPTRSIEEKTKVYVLVKESDKVDNPFILPAPVSTKAQPEVFIVKYKHQADLQKGIQDTQNTETESRFGDISVSSGTSSTEGPVKTNKRIKETSTTSNRSTNVKVGATLANSTRKDEKSKDC